MTEDEVRSLPVAVPLIDAGRALGISRNQCYALARAGEFPVPVYANGVRYLVVKARLLAFLGISPTE